jgi:hypothetical protein
LDRYASVFPIARPRYHRLAGQRAWLTGKRMEAFRRWRRGLAAATQLSMPYEAGLAHYEMARHSTAGEPERETHAAAARETFEQIGADRALAMLSREPGAADAAQR